MSLDGFLTFLGLMIATYAILTPVTRLRLHLQYIRQGLLAGIAVSGILFFEFFNELNSLLLLAGININEYINLSPHKTEYITNEEAAFLVVMLWMIFAYLLHRLAKPRATSLRPLVPLVERLHDEQRYLELIELLTPYLRVIMLADSQKLPFQRLHYKIMDECSLSINRYSFLDDNRNTVIPKMGCSNNKVDCYYNTR